MEALIQKVIQWAEERNIIEGSTALKQLDKTSEEFNELQRAVAVYHHLARGSATGCQLDDAMSEIDDAFGDILVTLIIAAHQLSISLPVALENAYEVIKDRKGKMINGKFVKEEDL